MSSINLRKVAFITGATRGIGKAIASRLAREGWNIAVAAKSVTEDPRIPGTIYSAADELRALGVDALPVQCNVMDEDMVKKAAEATLAHFGRVDVVINNASAIHLAPMCDFPMKKFDLVFKINARGTFSVIQAFLPQLQAQGFGHVISMSPPLLTTGVGHSAPYYLSKLGMTFFTLSVAAEHGAKGIKATALWPRTMIESFATVNNHLGEPAMWRKADIQADAVWEILTHPELSHGRAVIDEDFLREVGYTDFERYACVPGSTPPDLNELMGLVK